MMAMQGAQQTTGVQPGQQQGQPGMMPPVLIAPPQPWENHAIHLTIHRQFLVSDKFKELPPPIQMMMLMHMQAHYMMAAAAMPKARQPGQSGQTDEESASNSDAQEAAQPGVEGEPETE